MAKPRLFLVNRVYWPSTAATAQLLTDLAEGLAARNWPVHVVAAGEASTRHNGVIIHRTGGSERHGGLLSRVINYRRFRRDARRLLAAVVQPGDVVVVMTDPPMLGAALTSPTTQRGAGIVHWIQDIYPEIVTAHLGMWTSPWLGWLRARRDAAWQAARTCVVLGEDMAQLVAAKRTPAARIVIVPNWAPRGLQAPASAEAIAARRAAWNVTGKFVIAYSGNLGRVHEFAAVLDAAERLKAQRDLVFLFIGTGARFEEVRTAVRARALENVRLLPPEPRDNLAAALAAADLQLVTLRPAFDRLVYPSKLAGVLAAGRPVLFVGSSGGEIARLLARDQCGAAVGPDDGDRLARLIMEWHSDAALRAQLGRQARAAYERRFTFASALVKWEQILGEAAPTP